MALDIANFATDSVENFVRNSPAMNTDNTKKIAEWFDKAVADSPLDNQAVAELLGIDRTAVSKNRNGKRRVSAEEIILLAQTLGLSIPSLIENGSKPRINEAEPTPSPRVNGARFDNELYNLAYDKIDAADELSEPRMDPDEMLRQVHTLYVKLLSRQHKREGITLNPNRNSED